MLDLSDELLHLPYDLLKCSRKLELKHYKTL